MKCACVLLVALLLAAPLSAQSNCKANPTICSTGPLSIQITIGPALQLALSPGTTTLVTPTPAHYNAGFCATTGPTATVSANAPWTLSISASTATWGATSTGTEPARADKPATDLEWSLSPDGPFTSMTTSPANVTAGAPTAGTAVAIFYRTLYNWTNDTPGNYSLQLVFTIISP